MGMNIYRPRLQTALTFVGTAAALLVLPGQQGCPADSDGDGWTTAEGDCNDEDANVYPGAPEVCDGIDEDCDGVLDNGVQTTSYYDSDADGYGDPNVSYTACDVPVGYILDSSDCDDTRSDVNPSMTEICYDGLDNDCDTKGCDLYGTYRLGQVAGRINGVTTEDEVGTTVAAAGDVNGDGLGDVLVGALKNNGNDAGTSYLLSGPALDLTSISQYTARATGKVAADGAYVIASAGDMNADGFDDVLVGAPNEDTGGSAAGAVYLLFGPLSGELDLSLAGAILVGELSSDHAGTSVAPAGDVNADGYADLIVGAPDEDSGGSGAGAAYIINGPIAGMVDLSAASAKLIGEDGGDNAGYSVAGVGDVNADGYDDVLVGAPGDDTGGSTSGAAYLVLGPMAGLLDLSAATAKLAGEGYYAYAGYSVASAGDVNDDGYPGLLIGAPLAANSGNYAGAAYLVSSPVAGQISLSAATARLTGRSFYDFAGRTVSGAGDMNNDGYDDFMIGAPYNDASATDAGAAYFFYGPVSGTLDMGNASLVLQGENSYDYAGMSVSSGGDTNGDGYTELLIGAPRNDAGASSAGAAYLLKGGPRF